MNKYRGNLNLPILTRYGNEILIMDDRALRAYGVRFPEYGVMLCREAYKNPEVNVFEWILEANARFHDVKLVGARRTWARRLTFFVPLLSEYRLEEERSVTVGELKQRSAGTIDLVEDAPLSREFRKFLRHFGDSEIFSGEMLRSFMDGT